ncbi:MAG: ABC transporter ATP-binding protein [Verrucomicrobia bacterium]|nr:ABC transporter ATP-binding protein [Verrucomicrobiota bacterium]
MTPLLKAHHLVKRFGSRTAVEGVSFTLQRGESVGLLGPNGAGKSTTIGLLAGLLVPDEGEVQLEGSPIAGETDPRKRKLGLVPQELALYEELTARRNLEFFGSLQGLIGAKLHRAINEALQLVGLADRAGDLVKQFSGGMKRRLNLSVALLHDPELLLLDEPTVGVDPQSRNAIFDNIEQLRQRGKTILYTTHYMEEVERLCDRVIIVDHGRIVADDTLVGLKRRLAGTGRLTLDLSAAPEESTLQAFRNRSGITGVEVRETRVTMTVEDLTVGLAAVLEEVNRSGLRVRALESGQASLEDVFLDLTGRSLRDG